MNTSSNFVTAIILFSAQRCFGVCAVALFVRRNLLIFYCFHRFQRVQFVDDFIGITLSNIIIFKWNDTLMTQIKMKRKSCV